MSPTATHSEREAKARPLIMTGESVRRTLDGVKRQTRRVLTFPRAIASIEGGHALVAFDRMQSGYPDGTRTIFGFDGEPNSFSVRTPFGHPGDHLWVRETWASQTPRIVAYRADGECGAWMGDGDSGRLWIRHGGVFDSSLSITRPDSWRGESFGLGKFGGKWKSPILMPRWASRLILEITDVRVERLQEISEEDAKAEGVSPEFEVDVATFVQGRALASTYVLGYKHRWNEINATRSGGAFAWSANPWVWVISYTVLPSTQEAA